MALKDRLLGSTSGTPLNKILESSPIEPPPRFSGTINVSSSHASLRLNERGLVVSAPVRISGTTFHLERTGLDPQELRSNLLFWDRLAYPDNNFIGIGAGSDEEFLLSEGILFRPRAIISGGGDAATAFAKAHVAAFRYLDEREPGHWSLARGERSISFDDDEVTEGRGLMLRLYDAIPVPNEDVPLQEVLEFRAKREAELVALRHYIDEIYLEVERGPDKSLAELSALSKLDTAIADHIKSTKEAPFQIRLSGLDIKFDWKSVAIGIGAHQAAASTLPLSSSLLVGAGASALAMVSATAGLKKREKSKSPFEYISRYRAELFS